MTEDVHACPIAGCAETVPNRYVMCMRHWSFVPGALRVRLARSYSTGQDRRPELVTDPYRRARQAAIDAVNRIEAEKGRPALMPEKPTFEAPRQWAPGQDEEDDGA